MFEINGKHNTAKIFADSLEKSAVGEITALCNMPWTENSQIRIMPDAHAGAGCVVGTTITIKDKIVPNLVGVDIGCGMEAVNVGPAIIDFNKLDKVIREKVPSGFCARDSAHRFADDIDLSQLSEPDCLQRDKALLSIGSLGGGNHFIEVDKAENGDYWLIIHSGSRHPGFRIATHHQKIAGAMRREGIPYELAWLEGNEFDNYINDMRIMQEFADINRRAIASEILKGMKWKSIDSFTTIHNYVDTDKMILRKGAVSAQKGERLLIPLNMRDGSLLCEGLGNPEWNFSAPHGAGRLFSRKEAKDKLTLTQFKKEMQGVFSTCISRNTIDESPEAYKPMDTILAQIGPTVQIKEIIKPVYNFKAGGD